ncbi:YpmS family protein [Salibacterium aidingense]|uniref:YpmS family protein n=1 Tax=Salibacterium aidingense TaxID=384933 RepID=UPI003BDA10D1
MQNSTGNIWKWLFFILLGTVLLGVTLMFFLVSTSGGSGEGGSPSYPDNGEFHEYFTVQLTGNQLNQLLQEEMKSEQVTVQFEGETARMTAGIDFLGRTIEAEMEFETEIGENGSLVLSQHNVSLGRFSLPGAKALALLESQAELPDVVEVHPNDQQVWIKLDQMSIGNDYSIRAETFAPSRDEIVLQVGK